MLALWIILIVTWLWSGLHVVYAYTWMLIVFTVLNLLQSLYVVGVYTLVRHPVVIRKIKYLVNRPSGRAKQEDFASLPYLPPAFSKTSQSAAVNEAWDRASNQRSHSAADAFFINPTFGGDVHGDYESKDFDELIDALRVASTDGDSYKSEISERPSTVSMTRTQITDTHL